MILSTPTAEWSASLEKPCRKVMVIPLLWFHLGDNLMNCLPVGVDLFQHEEAYLRYLVLPGIHVNKISFSIPPSVLFRYLERLVFTLSEKIDLAPLRSSTRDVYF